MPLPPLLSVRDVFALLARLGEVAERVVLIGGQAVNVWSEFYLAQGRATDLQVDAPFTSKDIDFCATRDGLRAFVERLPNGRARFPTFDDATPSVGLVLFLDEAGYERQIDFLNAPYGMDAKAVERASVPLDVLDAQGQPTGVRFRIMHPIDCMESRVHNVVGLPGDYDTPRGRRQLHASVACAREALKDVLNTPAAEDFDPVRAVLDLNERIFNLCLRDRHGRVVAQRTGTDPFDAVLVDARLGESFANLRLPRVKARLAAQRAKLAAP